MVGESDFCASQAEQKLLSTWASGLQCLDAVEGKLLAQHMSKRFKELLTTELLCSGQGLVVNAYTECRSRAATLVRQGILTCSATSECGSSPAPPAAEAARCSASAAAARCGSLRLRVAYLETALRGRRRSIPPAPVKPELHVMLPAVIPKPTAVQHSNGEVSPLPEMRNTCHADDLLVAVGRVRRVRAGCLARRD